MVSGDEIAQGLQAAGFTPVAPTTPIPTENKDSGSFIDQAIVNPIKNAINDPSATVGATIRGVEKSFEPPSQVFGYQTGIPSNLTEKIEGSLMFPVIRGAELAAKMFSNEDHQPELTSFKQIVGDRIALTEALRQRSPGTIEGIELGSAAISAAQLLKSGVKVIGKISPQVWEKAAEVGSNIFKAKATKLAGKLLKEGQGPVLDAIVNRPDQVIDMIKNGTASSSDLAYEIGTQLEKTKTGLGQKVDMYKKAFVADPLNRVVVTEPVKVSTPQGATIEMQSPLKIIQDFRNSVTSTEGVSILDSKQEANLKALEKIVTPKAKNVTTSVDKGYGAVEKSYEVPVKDIHPKDAMLAIKAIDKMINYETAFGGGVDAEAAMNLLNVRRTLKYQIRGNNLDWFKADEDYANFMELQYGLTNKLKESDSAESFINNIFGNNKERVRERLGEALNYADHVDSSLVGSGDAFYRRLATIQAAKKVKATQLQITDPIQDNVNRIVNRYMAAGGIGGGYVATKMFGVGAMTPGSVVGGYAGYKIGQQMANPMRVLNAAVKSQKLSKQAMSLANDLSYIHKLYGNDGVISMLDIIGSTPAVNEIAKFSGSSEPQASQKPQYEVRAEKLGISP